VSSKYERDPDGLLREVVGPWVREKHKRVARYVDISRGVRRGFIGPAKAGATYVELFCGPGRSRVRDTDDVIDGSAIVAWRASVAGGAPFSKIIVADERADLVEAAVKRLQRFEAPVEYEVGPAAESIDKVMQRLNPYGLHVALLDPYGLRALPFDVVAKLGRLTRVDLLIHVSSQGLQRNLRRALAARHSALDIFAPGWSDGIDKSPSDDGAIRSRFWAHWRELIKREGLGTAQTAELIKGSKNQRLYWLAFAAKSERALTFWEKIRSIDGQREFKL
jgi:three-Cys-motif partner protein